MARKMRKKYWLRCDRCKMRREVCICSDIPQLSTATKLVLLAARRELQVPTNTGRLAAQALTNSVMLTRGDRDIPLDLAEHLPEGCRPLILYPADDAIELSPTMREGGPYTLVVPDGNWRQTSKMRRREPLLAGIQAVTLPPGPDTQYLVRRETKAQGLATIEAIARALGILEGDWVQRELEKVFALMVQRTLAGRGIGSSAR
jgi:DTW domain-containing protein YfiP